MPDLPVNRILPELRDALAARADVVLEAPPGAGKTTLVPLALLDAEWLRGQSIVLVQPRRVAARSAAARMAALLGEKPGDTVGYRIRLESRVSADTRIEVVTEGVLTRRLQQDPGLAGVGLLIFDEFHERNLDAELGLALGLQGRELFREGEPLRLLVMSATLSGIDLPRVLPGARVLTSEGRRYPVELHYRAGPGPGESPVPAVVAAVREALRDYPGHVLVFLPGQAEIRRASRELADLAGECLRLASLHGGLSLKQQQWAIDLPPEGVRKVVLATNIAETSLTIEGVQVVVDCGLERLARFDPATSTTRLTTRRISRASAEQRAGRAGRLGPGVALRLWSREQQARLVAQREPEVLRTDLAPLALQMLAWGVSEPGELAWLDTPPPALFQQALDLLVALGALRQGSPPQLTSRGLRLAELPLHPRLGTLLLTGAGLGAAPLAAQLAALLEARDPGLSRSVDLQELLRDLEGADERRGGWARDVSQQARRYRQLAQRAPPAGQVPDGHLTAEQTLAVLVASAWPDHIARARAGSAPGQYQLANGRSAELPGDDPLAGSEWLAVAELGGRAGEAVDRIWRAAALDPRCFESALADRVEVGEQTVWEGQRLRAWREQRVGALRLSREALDAVTPTMRADAWLQRLRERGLGELPWTEAAQQWCARVDLLRRLDPRQDAPWPATDEAALLERAGDWLWSALCAPEAARGLGGLDLLALLQQLLPWPLPRELEAEAPLAVTVPSGAARRIDYRQDSPVLAVKLQEMFGCLQTPRIAWGRQPLLLHLLSPAGRPLAVTANLETFWRDVYPQVRKEMKGRYPKHPWPEDPLTATATTRTRGREGAA
ncbi:MAG: ATP-dependent helicase HrpB [Haliea sp.]|nr:ATP-dependent helicase HrpB [Haliea sp.]